MKMCAMNRTRSLAERLLGCLAVTLAALLSTTVTADYEDEYYDPGTRDWSFLLGAQLTFGGDTLAVIDVENIFGDDDSSKIKAGEQFAFFLGGAYRIPDSIFQLQATIGYHVDGVFARNGDADFERFPAELLGMLNFGQHRIGAGITYHINPEFESDFFFVADENIEFKNASGLVVQYDYTVRGGAAIGIRFVDIEYDLDVNLGPGFNVEETDGSHVGLVFTYIW